MQRYKFQHHSDFLMCLDIISTCPTGVVVLTMTAERISNGSFVATIVLVSSVPSVQWLCCLIVPGNPIIIDNVTALLCLMFEAAVVGHLSSNLHFWLWDVWMSLCMDYADVFYPDVPMDTWWLTCHRIPRTFHVYVRQTMLWGSAGQTSN